MIKTYIETQQGLVDAKNTQCPSERIFRQAWQLNDGVIEVDMVKARDIWRDKIRLARSSALSSLDCDYMKAMEVADVTLQQSIAQQKQALRDAPKDEGIDTALNPDELKQVQPAGLIIS